MKKLLLFLLPMFGSFSACQNINEPSTSKIDIHPTFEMLYSEKYVQKTYVNGFEALAKIQDILYGVVIKNGLINFCAINKEKIEYLTKIEANNLQIGSGKAFVVDNLIYYEFLVEVDQYCVPEAQYFKLNVDTKIIKKIADCQLVDKNNRYTYDRSQNQTYRYQDYLVFLHSNLWYLDSSATTINLKNDQVTVFPTREAVAMIFNNGYLFYNKVTVKEELTENFKKAVTSELKINDSDTGETLIYNNWKKLRFGPIYSSQNQKFVSLVDQYDNPYNVSQILIADGQIVLKKITNDPYLIRLFYFYKNQTIKQESLENPKIEINSDLRAYDVGTGEVLIYDNQENLRFGQMYSYEDQVFVSLIDEDNNAYSIIQILIKDKQIVLQKIANNDDLIREVYFYNNKVYFYGLSYDYIHNINVVKIYYLKDSKLVELVAYFSRCLLNDSVFSSFNDQYLYLMVSANAIRINLLTKEIEEYYFNCNLIDVLYDDNKIYFGVFEEDRQFKNWVVGLAKIEWPKNLI